MIDEAVSPDAHSNTLTEMRFVDRKKKLGTSVIDII